MVFQWSQFILYFGFGWLGWSELKALLIKLQLAGPFSTSQIKRDLPINEELKTVIGINGFTMVFGPAIIDAYSFEVRQPMDSLGCFIIATFQ